MKKLISAEVKTAEALKIVELLVQQSVWFLCEPMPLEKYRFTVKDEHPGNSLILPKKQYFIEEGAYCTRITAETKVKAFEIYLEHNPVRIEGACISINCSIVKTNYIKKG